MRTSKNFSIITYNTEEFLLKKLLQFKEDGKINHFSYIVHDKDTKINEETGEEETKKPHIHCNMEPSHQIDTDLIEKELIEIDPNNELPIKPQKARTSDTDNFIDYIRHIPEYIKAHCPHDTDGKHQYQDGEIVSDDLDYLKSIIESANDFLQHDPKMELQNIINLINEDRYIKRNDLVTKCLELDLYDCYKRNYYILKDLIIEHNQDYDQHQQIENKADMMAIRKINQYEKTNKQIANLTEVFDRVTVETEDKNIQVMATKVEEK